MSTIDRRTTLKRLAAALLLPLLPGCALPPTRPERIVQGDTARVTEYLSAWLQHEVDQQGLAGLSIAVLDGQQVAWSAGFGLANKADKTPATARTRYRAGSISKLFTSAAALHLAERGQFDIDAPLEQALPGFSIRRRAGQTGAVTPRAIMSHHSGLSSDWIEGMWTDSPAPYTELVEALRAETLAFPPGLVYAYSNLAFSLLGAAIEQASGQPLPAFMQSQLLRPLGMTSSGYELGPPSGADAALGYDAAGKPGHELALRDLPAGGLNTTVLDLLQFARMFCVPEGGKTVLSAASLAEMVRPQNAACPLDVDQRVGLGWHFGPTVATTQASNSGRVLFHGGGTLHHCSMLMVRPEQGLAVAVMSNSSQAMDLVGEAAKRALALFQAAKTGVTQPEEAPPFSRDPRFPAVAPARLPGYYATEVGLVKVWRDNTRLRVDLAGHTLRLEERAHGYLGLEYRLLGLLPIKLGDLGRYAFTLADIGGREVLLACDGTGTYLGGEKLAPVAIPPAWHARLGEYRYVGGDAFLAQQIKPLRLLVEADYLIVDTQNPDQPERLALAPLSDDEAFVRGLGRGRGDSVRVRKNGAQETLHYAGLSFQRIQSEAQSG